MMVAVAPLLLLGLLVPQVAPATIKCRFDTATRVLSVSETARNFSDFDVEAAVRRVGADIGVFDPFREGRVHCQGSPTVANTDEIGLHTDEEGEITIALLGGPFAPGATPESDSSSEIEFTVSGPGEIRLLGGPEADHFRFMTASGQTGVNLNPGPGDEDIDILLPPSPVFFEASGGPGPDTIDFLGHPRLLVDAEGNGGDDTLDDRGSGLGVSVLEGNGGRDRIFGGRGRDLIIPGGGPDLVDAGSGPDAVVAEPDKQRDTIDCGAGHDRLGRRGRVKALGIRIEISYPHSEATADPFDRLRSCERVQGR
jgi:hypothetical protein